MRPRSPSTRRGGSTATAGLPAVPVREAVGGQPLGGTEVGALGVGDREQPALAVLVVRDAEDVGHLALAVVEQVQRRPAGAQPTGTQRQAEAPDGREQRRPERHTAQRLLLLATED